MTIDQKEKTALNMIEKMFAVYKRPCVLCSFGKDSMLLLHMIREHFTTDIPIVWFKQPFFPRKFHFANQVIADWDLQVFSDIPPVGCTLAKGNGLLEVMNHYSIGEQNVSMPVGWVEPKEGEKFLCGKEDIFNRPFGHFNWRWDLAFCGHKGNDKDAVQGEVSLRVDVHQVKNSCSIAYPLRVFSDADVWELTERWKVPIHEARYEKLPDGTWRTKPEKTFDPDYFPYCAKCMDKDGPASVLCPKTNLEITNIGKDLQYVQAKDPWNYIGK